QMVVQKALDMIEERIENPPSLAKLALFSGLSRTYFFRVFKETTGIRLQDYLIQTRLNKAKILLNDANLKIKQIAYKVGFRNPDYFCRLFKKKTGVSPTEWRTVDLRPQKS
ncbi:MAG: AraC family transcriptional regulator, partial [Deltaproteobacteria bacterium]|nr:AraC family transcriptional regulator [Deltaproteobacteria bacterium]